MQGQMLNTQINQPPINNQAVSNQPMANIQSNQMINQMSNQPSKIQMNQIMMNPQQTGTDVNQTMNNQQMIDSNSNMNQITMINQVGAPNQIITQNQHMQQPNQQMQRVPLQQNRMILTGTQVRPGQIINQNFHVNRLRPANVQMQQPNEYFQQQPNQQQMNQQQINQQQMNQQQAQFQSTNQQQQQFQQTNVQIQNTTNMSNMNQMPNQMSNTIQMAASPGGNYVVPSPSNVMSSPMNVNIINQRPPSSVPLNLNSSPNPTLNTPVMSANSSPQMRQQTNDEQFYKDKLRQLAKYIEPLKNLVIKNESSDNANPKENQKIKYLLDVISDPSKRVSINVLLKCEEVLEKLEPINKTNVPQPSSSSQPIQTNLMNTSSKDYNICGVLMDTIMTHYKKPNFNHTLQRTIGPAVAAITNNMEYSYKNTNVNDDQVKESDEGIPHIVQGEIARLDSKFYVELDQLQHLKNKTIHFVCRIDEFDLPCVPPISIKVPLDYPDTPPTCFIDKDEYSSTKFFQDTYRIFNMNLERLPNSYTITTLLDRWELSIREALSL